MPGLRHRPAHIADQQGLSPDQRVQMRNQKPKTILDRLHGWMVRTAAKEPPEAVLHKACGYSLNHWTALTRFLEDGRLTPENNLCELQIRTLAIGRKNFLFAGSDVGAEHAAILYSFFRTSALHGVDSDSYLIDVVEKSATGWPASRLDELLPDNWRRSQPAPDAQAT